MLCQTRSVRAQRALASATLEVLESRCLLSTIDGHVYAANGNAPLGGISISVSETPNDPNDGGMNANQWVGGTVTNADGSFQIDGLPSRNCRVFVQDQSAPVQYQSQTFYNVSLTDGHTTTEDVYLLDASRIAGHVSSLAGAPLPGISIDIFQSSDPNHAGPEAWNWVAQGTTDAQGDYVVGGLDARSYRVQVSDGAQSGATHYIGANLYDVVTVTGATTTGMNLQLRPAGVLSGHVYTTGNQPIANAQVLVDASWTRGDDNNTWHTVSTDANGLYTFYLPVTDQAIYPLQIADAPLPPQQGPSQYYAVQIAPDLYSATLAGTQGYDFHLSLGGVITGTAVTDTGLPVSQIDVVQPDVHIANGMFRTNNGWPDNQGHYEIHGVPANTDIYLQTTDWGWSDFSINGVKFAQGTRLLGPFRVAAGGTLDIGQLVIPRAGTVRGVVTDTHGTPIVGAKVRIVGVDSMGGAVKSDNNTSNVSDAFGQYQVASMPPGRYQVQVTKDGWVRATSAELIVASGQTVLHDVVLHDAASGFSVTGSIANFDQVAPTNQLGQKLPSNIITEYDYYDRSRGLGVIAMPQGMSWTAGNMLNPDSHFTGMTDVNDGFADYFVPDPQNAGKWSLDLPTGAQSLMAYREMVNGLGSWQIILSDPVAVDAAAGQTINSDIAVPVGTSTIAGQLTLPPGYRAPGDDEMSDSVTIWLKDTGAGASPMGRAITRATPSGQYALTGVPAGTYSLYIVAPGLQPFTSGSVTVPAGQTVTASFSLSYGATESGYVRNAGQPVANAVVRSENTDFSTITDANGHYLLSGLLSGQDTLTVVRPGYTDVAQTVTLANGQQATLDVDVEGADASITGKVVDPAFLTDGIDNNQNGLTDEPGEQLLGGITVVAYNKDLAKSYVAYSGSDGVFSFTNLAPGKYRLVTTGAGFDSAIYPLASTGDLIVTHSVIDLTDDASQIAMAVSRPQFTVSSTSDASTLTITIRSDRDLLGLPVVSLVQGSGVLGTLTPIDARTGSITYTLGAGDTLVRLQVQEDAAHAVVPGNPASRTFAFDVTSQLQQLTNTNFVNAEGASVSMMGSQDNVSVYLPPFALTTDDSGQTQAMSLTVSRYGDPGESLDSGHTSLGSSYDFVIGDDGGVQGVTLAHEATVTMSFTLPQGMTEQQFRQTLTVGFYNNSAGHWVWNDLADSNPTSGISNIQINWLSNTITFKAAHFTKFAVAMTPLNQAPTDLSVLPASVLKTWPGGTVVGTLSATDPDAGDAASMTYALVAGTGSTNNSMFTIVGNQLKTNAGIPSAAQGSYSIRVQAMDAGGLTFEKAVAIAVAGTNVAPTDVRLSKAKVAENQGPGTTVGTLTAVDANAGDSFTYSFTGGALVPDNASFTIDGATLKTNASFDYETKKVYSIRVRAFDKGLLKFTKDLTVNVTNVNDAPTSLSLSAKSIAENMPAGTVVGTTTTVDQDLGNTFTYAMADGGADNAAFKITADGRLKTAQSFNFELKSSYSIRIRSTDQGGLFCEKPITIKVTNVNEAPTGLALSNYSVPNQPPINTVVGNLIGTDPDAGNTLTYSLVDGTGSRDNALFKIIGVKLKTADIFNDAAKTAYKIRVRVTDQNGLSYEKAITIGVTQ